MFFYCRYNDVMYEYEFELFAAFTIIHFMSRMNTHTERQQRR
jgi:hypothetical protein